MLILLFILFTVLVIFLSCKEYDIAAIAVTFFNLVLFIVLIFLAFQVSDDTKIQDVKTMYEEENNKIESQMDELVKQYMKYEKETLMEFKGKDVITIISMYPELKSDTLVEKQLNTYVENNEKIKELKRDEIYAPVRKWWLYFGK